MREIPGVARGSLTFVSQRLLGSRVNLRLWDVVFRINVDSKRLSGTGDHRVAALERLHFTTTSKAPILHCIPTQLAAFPLNPAGE